MAIHPIPDSNPAHMAQSHGTRCLITDPKADRYLAQARKERVAKMKELKAITDAWTI
jgi:hypothetical protein